MVVEARPLDEGSERMSENKLYVGNLSFGMTEDSLTQVFSEYGAVTDAKIVNDRDTGRSRGFAFVEMGSAEDAQAAIRGLDGQMVDGRNLTVNVARPREGGGGGGRRGGGGGYGGGGGGYGGGGGGGYGGGGGGRGGRGGGGGGGDRW
jgi:RNA recognition motif-containing protein